jgi:phosphatidylglycerophosphate synthase
MSFPTQLTVLRILLVPVFYVLFAVIEPAQMFWAGLVFLIAALSDWYDMAMSRADITRSLRLALSSIH